MTETKRLALVARLNQKLKVHGSWCGETHMQKATYFLQYMLDVRMDFDFVLYMHGPYSFDLRDAISQMRADGILEVRQRPYPYGPSLVVPPEQEVVLERRFSQTLKRYGRSLDFVAAELGGKRVSELERLATALYVSIGETSVPVNKEGTEARAAEAACRVWGCGEGGRNGTGYGREGARIAGGGDPTVWRVTATDLLGTTIESYPLRRTGGSGSGGLDPPLVVNHHRHITPRDQRPQRSKESGSRPVCIGGSRGIHLLSRRRLAGSRSGCGT